MLAEVAEKYLKKGSLVHIEGKIKTRSYDDKDGNKRYITEVVAEGFKMLDSKKDATSGGGGNYSSSTNSSVTEQAPATTSAPDDDLPF